VNTHMVRYPSLKHIMLNHGDSDKSPSFNPVSRMYDRNFVAGQAAIDRFRAHGVDVFPDQFAIVGRPQIANLKRAAGPIADIPRPNVLYAPTWAGFTSDAQYSSLPWARELVAALQARGCNVIFRPHPYAYRTPEFRQICSAVIAQLAADPDANAAHVYGKQAETVWSISDCIDASDAMISDVSSVANDYLWSEKPLAITVVRTTKAKFAADNPLAEGSYLLVAADGGFKHLDARLEDLLRRDPLRAKRLALKSYILGDPGDQPYDSLFTRTAMEYVREPPS